MLSDQFGSVFSKKKLKKRGVDDENDINVKR